MQSLHRCACRMLLWMLVTALAPMAAGQTIFKCVDRDGRTAYQSRPCEASAAETLIASAAPPPAPATVPSVPAARHTGCPPPWRHCTLTLGMPDDEVLNLAGWGRPERIARTRSPREWHEEWIYGEGTSDERRLHFANARLVDIARTPERFAALPVRAY